MNKCLFTGNLVRDPELKTLESGTQVVNFTLAVNNTFGKGENRVNEVAYLNCEAWSKGAEVIANYFSKGEPITVDARVRTDSYNDKDGNPRSVLRFRVNEFWFVPKYPYKKSAKSEKVTDEKTRESDGDIPF